MFTISNQTDYAMLLLEYLAKQQGAIALSKVVKELRLPRRYLAQIAAKLVQAQILESREGIKGGYKLIKPLVKIRLYDILRLFEGDIKLVKCAHEDYNCQWEAICQHSPFWKKVLTERIVSSLNTIYLKDIVIQKQHVNYKKS